MTYGFRVRHWSRSPGGQPADDVSRKPHGRLPLVLARPAVTFPLAVPRHPVASTTLYCWVTEVGVGEWLSQRRGWESNSRPPDRWHSLTLAPFFPTLPPSPFLFPLYPSLCLPLNPVRGLVKWSTFSCPSAVDVLVPFWRWKPVW